MAETTAVRPSESEHADVGGGIMRRLSMWTGILVGVVVAVVCWFVGNALWGENDQGLDQAGILTEVGWVLGFLVGVGAFVAPVRWILGKDLTHDDEMFLAGRTRASAATSASRPTTRSSGSSTSCSP